MPNQEKISLKYNSPLAIAIREGSLVRHKTTDHIGFVEKIFVEKMGAKETLKVRWRSENNIFYHACAHVHEVEHYHDFDV